MPVSEVAGQPDASVWTDQRLVGHTAGEVTVGVVVLFLIVGAISVGIWSYFRYRPERWIPKRAR